MCVVLLPPILRQTTLQVCGGMHAGCYHLSVRVYRCVFLCGLQQAKSAWCLILIIIIIILGSKSSIIITTGHRCFVSCIDSELTESSPFYQSRNAFGGRNESRAPCMYCILCTNEDVDIELLLLDLGCTVMCNSVLLLYSIHTCRYPERLEA